MRAISSVRLSSAPAALALPAAVLARGAAAGASSREARANRSVSQPSSVAAAGARAGGAGGGGGGGGCICRTTRCGSSRGARLVQLGSGARGAGGATGGAGEAASRRRGGRRRRGLEAAARRSGRRRGGLRDVIGAARARDNVGQLIQRLHLLADDAAQRGGLLGGLARQLLWRRDAPRRASLELALDCNDMPRISVAAAVNFSVAWPKIREIAIRLIIGGAQRGRVCSLSRRRRRAPPRNARRRDRRCRASIGEEACRRREPAPRRGGNSPRRGRRSPRPRLRNPCACPRRADQVLERAAARVERGVELLLSFCASLSALCVRVC